MPSRRRAAGYKGEGPVKQAPGPAEQDGPALPAEALEAAGQPSFQPNERPARRETRHRKPAERRRMQRLTPMAA